MIDIRYGPPAPTVPGKVSVPISAAYSGGLLFTIPVEIKDTGDAQKNEDAASARLRVVGDRANQRFDDHGRQ